MKRGSLCERCGPQTIKQAGFEMLQKGKYVIYGCDDEHVLLIQYLRQRTISSIILAKTSLFKAPID